MRPNVWRRGPDGPLVRATREVGDSTSCVHCAHAWPADSHRRSTWAQRV